MKKNQIYTNNAPKAVGPYSQAIEYNGVIYVSGIIAIDPQTGSLSGTVEEQTDRILISLQEILTSAGSSMDKVLKTDRDLIFIFDSEDTVKNLTPDFSKIKQFPVGLSAYVTAKSEEFDFVARAFWPKINIDEDPVCGTMYCSLIPYWREHNGLDKMVARQVSKRGGTVYCEYCGERVKLSGRAALYLIGDICVDEEMGVCPPDSVASSFRLCYDEIGVLSPINDERK